MTTDFRNIGSLFGLFILLSVREVTSLYQSPPRIVKQPPTDELLFQVQKPSENINEKPFIIECEAEGEPAPKYYWIKNGKNFDWQAYDDRISQQPGRGTLVISSPRNEDLGQYQCFAHNDWGTATSNSVFVRKAELNSFKDGPPTTIHAQEGEPLKLACQPPDGWPKPYVYWLIQTFDGSIKSINNSRMAVDPEGNLWFTNVTRYDTSDDFYYVCAASSLFRNEYKLGNKVRLNVIPSGSSGAQNKHEPVEQYVSRKNEVALRGSKLEIFCIYGGTPLPQIVWSKDGHIIHLSERVTQGNFGKSIIINSVQFEDEGSYTCEASNGVGEAKSYSIHLRVLAIPYFTVEPEFVSAAEDETAEFHCEASGIPEPQIKWVYNGKPITEAPSNPRRTVTPNSIRIERLTKKDTGNYGCNATNSLGYVYKDVYINVLALKPDITEAPKDKEVVDGKTVMLTCRVFGAPKPEVKWVRQGIELTGGRYTVQPEGDLEIKDVNFLDSGHYTCHASNKLGSVSSSARLLVREHTRITDVPEDYEVSAGTPATFRCNAVSDSSLTLSIDWQNNGELIDFESEPRFIRSNDYSLTITKTTELDSGTYTCVASTALDEATAQATLTVQDVPNSPELLDVSCSDRDATISWKSLGDNRAPILRYSIDYNTSFTPDSWESANDNVPAADTTFTVPMTPWANYTFRVSAWNKVGPSPPSSHSEVCTTLPDVPYKNPDNVEGKGTRPNNMVISWTPMPEIEHHAPRFQYRVFWKPEKDGSWTSSDVSNPHQSSLEIPNLNTFEKFYIKVLAINEKGESSEPPKQVIGYSGEDVPLEAPTNFTVLKVVSATTADLSWNPVPPSSLRGHFRGYKIQTWVEKEENNIKESIFDASVTHALIGRLTPYAKNYARVLAFNSMYNGPPSEIIPIETPEGVPGTVRYFEAFPMGSSALLLIWKPPQYPNGILTGYKIYYQTVKGTNVGPLIERKPPISDPKQLNVKLAGLQPATKYRLHILATTVVGEGEDYFIEQRTRGSTSAPPDRPDFNLIPLTSDNGYCSVKVVWLPNVHGKSGSHFYVKYRIKGSPVFEETAATTDENFTIVRSLLPSEIYEFQVVSVDGDFIAESDTQELEMYSEDGPIIRPTESVVLAGWFIGMLLAILVMILLLVLVCFIRRKRGTKYIYVERDNGHHDYPHDAGFHEYSQPLDSKSHGRSSYDSEPKRIVDSDDDSVTDYGERDTRGLNEDGTFIGQYGRKREPASGGFATIV